MKSRGTGRVPALTELGMGAAQFGNLYRATSDDASTGAVDAAWAAGIRYFDTSPHYGLGLSERRLGAALATRSRDEYVLSTKVDRLLVPSPETAGERDTQGFDVPADHRRQWDFTRDGVLRSIEASLERLGLDRIDIAYVHDPDDHVEEAITQTLPALIELRDQGVVSAIGLGMNQTAVPAEAIRRVDLDVVMCAGRFTLLEQGALDDLLPLALDRGVAIVAAGVYNSGMLSTPRPAADATHNYEPAPPGLIAKAIRIAEVCELHGVSLPQAAAQYPLQHPAVVSVVLGMRTAEQVAENAVRFEVPIPDALWDDLAERRLIRG